MSVPSFADWRNSWWRKIGQFEIFTYVWIVTNRKRKQRRGKVQLINAVDLYRKMRKSLNNKRNEIAPEHIEEITRIYGEFAENGRSKIFDNDDFGYRQITVERPLRLNFQASPDRIERLREATAFVKLAAVRNRSASDGRKRGRGRTAAEEVDAGADFQEAIVATLKTLDPDRVYKNRTDFESDLLAAFEAADLKLPAPLKKVILAALSERDEAAEICRDADGNPKPDPDYATTRTSPSRKISAYTSSVRSVPTCPTPGLTKPSATTTTARSAGSATKSPSTATSTHTRRPVRLKKSRPTSRASKGTS
jgi:type I restriction enzyme M protein